jgi:chromate transporter
MNSSTQQRSNTIWSHFLKDVFVCSLGAYGGPEAHFGIFTDQLVSKKQYLSEEELVELIALCSILPGPTSTQTIVSIGYKTGGPLLAFLTMMVWALPVLTVMGLLSFLYQFLDAVSLNNDGLRYIGPMAVGFIVLAAYRIGKKVATSSLTLTLLIASGIITYLIRSPWIFPSVLVLGGIIALIDSKETNIWSKVTLSPPWHYFVLFAVFALGSLLLGQLTDNLIVRLFESFYRYGYLVFGGGQVVVPVMHSELVQVHNYMTNEEFLTGYGLVQGLPGPMFSFSAYAGGMAARGGSVFQQILGAVAGGLGIFLPGLLLIYFVYPVWDNLREIKAIKIALKGINAVAGGLIAVSAIVLMQKSGFKLDYLLVTAITVVLLYTKKVPAPLIVVGILVAGFLL